jgi:prepilin-type N-terminal cleavage/methylation domain-containing protein
MYPRHNFRIRGRRIGAFTLIELLCVVAIITLLISIMLPSLAGAREQGRKALCMNHQKELATANQYYSMDYQGLLPDYDRWLWNGGDPGKPITEARIPESGQLFGRKQGSKEGMKYQWGKKVGTNYAVMPEIYMCPSDRGERRNPYIAADRRPPAKFSYTRNKFVMDVMQATGSLAGWAATDTPYYLPVDEVVHPAQTPLMVEEHETSAFNDGYSFPLDFKQVGDGEQDYLSMRHANRAVLSYFDLHVDAVRSKEVNVEPVDAICWSESRARLLAPTLPRPTVAPAK